MSYLLLLILVTLAAFAVASCAVAAGIAVGWRCFANRLPLLAGAWRATPLLLLRLAPVALGLFASAIAAVTFLRYEPRHTGEIPGPLLVIAAAAAVGLGVAGVRRAIRRIRATRRFLRAVEASAAPLVLPDVSLAVWTIESAFPLVAVVGIRQPRLLLARGVLDAISPDELRVVLAHELAHAERRDNAVRLLFTALPDLLSVFDERLGLERAWELATEEAADDFATHADPQARITLAAALVRVSRMAVGQPAPTIPLLAFHRGGSVERRVRRLLDPPVRARRSVALTLAPIATLVVSTVIAWSVASDFDLSHVHEAIEWLVNVPR